MRTCVSIGCKKSNSHEVITRWAGRGSVKEPVAIHLDSEILEIKFLSVSVFKIAFSN